MAVGTAGHVPDQRSIPARSPAGRYTDWSTLKPLCGQVRMTVKPRLLPGSARLRHGLAQQLCCAIVGLWSSWTCSTLTSEPR